MNARSEHRLGLVHDLPAEDYFAAEGVSNSMLSSLNRSPAHCWALHLDPERPTNEPTAAMIAGTLCHTLMLEPATVSQRYVVRPEGVDFRTKDGKAWRDANVGRQIVTAEDMATAEAQRAALLAVPELAHALSNGRAEVSAFWIDSRTGLLCKLRADWLHTLPDGRVIVVDLKTTADADPAEFGRSVWKFGYHRQAAHYTAGLTACGIDVAAFLFAAVTNARPFLAVPYMLDDEATRKGAEQVVELLDRFAECRRANHWPAYGDGVQVLSLPAWAK
jgi:hypothetical protein